MAQATRAPTVERRDLHLMALGVIEGLRKAYPETLDYSDALACILMLLAEDYSAEYNPEIFDLEKAVPYARRAYQLAEWTCRQPPMTSEFSNAKPSGSIFLHVQAAAFEIIQDLVRCADHFGVRIQEQDVVISIRLIQ